MSEASTLLQPAPTADAQRELKTIRVSRASAKHNRVIGHCELGEIVEQIRTGSGGVRAKVERIREKFWQVLLCNKLVPKRFHSRPRVLAEVRKRYSQDTTAETPVRSAKEN
jgi:hypothetical protein